MTQMQWLILAFRVVTIAGFLSLVGWVAIYTWFGVTGPAKWWRNPVGRTLVIKTCLIALLLIPSILSLFFDLNRLTSVIAGWVDAALIGLITPVMVWRSVVWIRLHRAGALHPGESEQ